MARVHPIECEFTNVQSAQSVRDGADVEDRDRRPPGSSVKAAMSRGLSGLERAFSAMSRVDNEMSFSRSSSALSALSAISRADNLSFTLSRQSSLQSELDDREPVGDDEEPVEPAAEGEASLPQPTTGTPHEHFRKGCISLRKKIWKCKMRARSTYRRRMRSTGVFGPASLGKARIWLAAYVSLADYVSDVYTISVRPLCCSRHRPISQCTLCCIVRCITLRARPTLPLHSSRRSSSA